MSHPSMMSSRRLAYMRLRGLKLLPDICQIYTLRQTVDEAGMVGVPERIPALYKGSSDIPCRLDASTHYRQVDVFDQDVTMHEYVLSLPRDLDITNGQVVEQDGVAYEIRKISNAQSWDVVTLVLLVRMEVG